uniref:KIB1-4 beta-propeller domain-containing protein n=1 Tax=Phtheirospermum japonicum TaxID=374723 RepID=A0A830C403_9LAMI
MLPPSTLEEGRGIGSGVDKMIYNFYSLDDNKVISFNPSSSGGGGEEEEEEEEEESEPDVDESEFVGSSHGWIALFNPWNCDLFLSNPLSRRHIKLPPSHTIYVPPNDFTNVWVDRIIITCSPESQECRALMLYGKTLAFCCPNGLHSTTHWVGPIVPDIPYGGEDCNFRGCYNDFVYSNKHKLLFCLDYPGLEAWDITTTSKPRLVWSDGHMLREHYCPWLDQKRRSFLQREDDYWCDQHRYLIVFDDQLFLMTRDYVSEMAPDGSCVQLSGPDDDYPHKTVGFDVHRIDREGRKLSYMGEGSLDGLAMFVGHNHSFAVRAAEYPGLNPNSIYFTDHWFSTPRRVERAYGGHDIGIFDYENKTISPCYYPIDVQSFKRIMPAPLWFTPSPSLHPRVTN